MVCFCRGRYGWVRRMLELARFGCDKSNTCRTVRCARVASVFQPSRILLLCLCAYGCTSSYFASCSLALHSRPLCTYIHALLSTVLVWWYSSSPVPLQVLLASPCRLHSEPNSHSPPVPAASVPDTAGRTTDGAMVHSTHEKLCIVLTVRVLWYVRTAVVSHE